MTNCTSFDVPYYYIIIKSFILWGLEQADDLRGDGGGGRITIKIKVAMAFL